MARPLTKEERTKLGVQALRLRARGLSLVQIAEQLETTPKTVSRAIKEVAPEVFPQEEREALRVEVLQSIMEVKMRAWAELDRRREPTPEQKRRGEPGDRIISPTSRTLPALLEVIGRQDDRLVKLLGLAEPEEIPTGHQTPAERVRAFEEWRRKQGRPPLHAVKGGAPDPSAPSPD